MAVLFSSSTGNELAVIEDRYRRLLVDRFDRLTFKGISRSGKAVSLPLEDVYVELKSVVDVPDAADAYSADERRVLLEAEEYGTHEDDMRRQFDNAPADRWREESRRGEARLVRRSIEEAVSEPGSPGLVILGDPGSGKSTLLHYLALRAAKEGLREAGGEAPRLGTTLRSAKGNARLPIFVPLAAYDDWLRCGHGTLSLGEFLPLYYEKWSSFPGLAPLFRQALDEGRALVLLDGLDEVLEVGTRRHIAGQARALIQGETPRGNRFVVTSRLVGYREASLSGHLPEVSVLDFGLEEIATFAHKWCEAFEVWFGGGELTDTALQSAAKEERGLLEEVRANPSVLRLAANPLLLTMLSLLRRQVGGKLPDERVKLYERYIDMLLDNNWETVRNEGARTREPVRFDRKLASNYLIDLALWLQRHKPSGTARRNDLESALVEISLQTDGLDPIRASAKDRAQARERAQLFLEDMRHFAGILAELGRDAFGFLHLTFQEYFAGRALARMEPEERWGILKENLHLPRWREPLLLCAGQLGLIEQRVKLVSDLGRKVLGAASPHEEMLHRDVLLVAAMAADGVGLERGLLAELTQRLMALADGDVPTVRVECLTGLAKLALFGHVEAASWLEDRVKRRTNPWDMTQALQGVIAADSCTGLRRAMCEWLDHSDIWINGAATFALQAAVANDKEVRRLVLAKFDDADEYIRQMTISALGALMTTDNEVRHHILAKLDDASEGVRATAVYMLGVLLANDVDVRRLILTKLDDTSASVRQASIGILGLLATSDDEARRLILAKLDDANEDVRQEAVGALGGLVTSDESARHLLFAKLDDANANMRAKAIGALAVLVPSNEEVCRLLLTKLGDAAWKVRQAAINGLAPLISTDTNARTLALAGLGHKPCFVSHEMIDALAPLISHDAKIRQFVTSKLDVINRHIRWAAVRALGALAPSDDSVRDLIITKLDDAVSDVRIAAIDSLGSLVAGDAVVHSLILAKLDDANSRVRARAQDALNAPSTVAEDAREPVTAQFDDASEKADQANIDARTAAKEEFYSLLMAQLDDDDEGVQREAIIDLATLIESDKEVRRRILSKLDDVSEYVRITAVYVLVALVKSDDEVRRRMLSKLDDINEYVRQETIGALAEHASSDELIRRLIIAKLDDVDENVQKSAIAALESVALSDPETQGLLLGKLSDAAFAVRAATVNVLAPLVGTNLDLRERLLGWLGLVGDGSRDHDETRRRLAVAYAPLLAREPSLLAQVVTMLRSPAWPARKGAAWAIIAMPGGPPPELLPRLRNLLKDRRGEENWPERLDTAALLINDRDANVSRRALDVTLEGLDYAAQPWYGLSLRGREVRAQAAMVLGTLEPIYRNDNVLLRLTRVLQNDDDETVRDAAYKALLLLSVSPEPEHDIESLLACPSETQQIPFSAHNFNMPPLPKSLVLHLSDLHFDTAENAVTWFSQLAEDLNRELTCSRLDAVILSGDIANKSTSEEYEAACLFLDKLRGEFQLSKEQVILVPGNHDLNWGLAKKGYKLTEREDCPGELKEGHFINLDDGAIRLRDDALYIKRFEPFAAFYEAVCGKPYPLAPTEQAILYSLPAQRLLVVGLNSAWELDHHFKARASINEQALSRAIDQIRAEPAYKDFLKIAVWHHPVNSPFEDRIKNHGFLERLANADFRLGLHGHIHKAQTNLYRYDLSPAGRRLELVCAGTFGAPTRELVPGYPFQYQLLRFEGSTLTVETRRREEIHGAWKPDARWTTERGKDPAPRYQIKL